MARGGSNPGERRGGRKKGVPNKLTADMRELAQALAQPYLPAAFRELGRLSTGAQNEATRVAAITVLFDRGFGKAVQPISGDSGSGPVQVELIKRIIVYPDGTED